MPTNTPLLKIWSLWYYSHHMPILKNAIKKMRQDKKRTEANKSKRTRMRTVMKTARIDMTPEAIAKAYSALDKAAKKHLIHKKKADRLKSRLALAIARMTGEAKVEEAPKAKKAAKPAKKATKKTTKKATKTA